jgi:hypothetical protein
VHPVWHISQLEPFFGAESQGRSQPLPDPIQIDGEAEHEVSTILDSKLNWQCQSPLMYLIKWTGYKGTPEESTWEPAENLEHSPEVIQEFH